MPRILLDSCVWGGAHPALLARRHDVAWAGSWSADPGDDQILAAAHSEQRILVTLDKDFGELAVVKGAPHCGIIRLCGFRARQMAPITDHLVTTYHRELAAGAIITADPKRIRIRPANH
jgi:predicted nuclease of predicted toxin-antitoxin system